MPVYGSAVDIVVLQHVEDLGTIWRTRSLLTRAGHVALRHLARFDERLAAHHDGCVVAGRDAIRILQEGFAEPSAPHLFAAAAVALQQGDVELLERSLQVAEAIPETRRGLISALGWTAPESLAGVVRGLLTGTSPVRRSAGLAAIRVHAADPGTWLAAAAHDSDPLVRSQAFRVAGATGKGNPPPASVAGAADDDSVCRFWGAWAGVMLGNRGTALDQLANMGLDKGPERRRALRLTLQAASRDRAHAMLQHLARDSSRQRDLLEGSGIVGDPAYVPWLLSQMRRDDGARLAGEAFSLITGIDLALLDLERKPPEPPEIDAAEDADSDDVHLDEDDGLPWPHADRIHHWWDEHGGRFTSGERYFMGEPINRARCLDVLRNGFQRQRILAAHYLCLLDPGTVLFNTSAPAWRQQRLLAQMS